MYLDHENCIPDFVDQLKSSKKIDDVTFPLNITQAMMDKNIQNTFYSNHLQLFKSNLFGISAPHQPEFELDDGTKEYKVEKVVLQRNCRVQNQDLAKWAVYLEQKLIWLAEKELINCKDLLKQFHTSTI